MEYKKLNVDRLLVVLKFNNRLLKCLFISGVNPCVAGSNYNPCRDF